MFINRYHTGSLAFGSLIIAIIQVIRIILEYIDHKLKGKENKVVKFIICCCKCCFWCLEKFMKFLNRNAYIMVRMSVFCFVFLHDVDWVFVFQTSIIEFEMRGVLTKMISFKDTA